jgi:hypothetical protein
MRFFLGSRSADGEGKAVELMRAGRIPLNRSIIPVHVVDFC